MASGSDDGTVRFWNIETGRPAGVIRKTQIIETLAFSPDGQVLAAGDRTIRLWRAATKDEVEAAGEWWKD